MKQIDLLHGYLKKPYKIRYVCMHEELKKNSYIQVMMKDQYANYVVQKVLEICDDQHREVLLSSIRAHLPLLKKYTYGKHIVAYVEKLGASGGKLFLLPSYHYGLALFISTR